MAMYFKGGSGIKNPVDVDGKPIKEGDILTHCYFQDDYPAFFTKHYPNWDNDKIKEVTMKPSVIVKWNPDGFFYGEGFEEIGIFGGKAYMHDFEFKHTKIIKQQ